ncbi:MAG: hypothetical protein M1836_005929 [Candelina mexicana]|nr:MAG: hypothetical protein M1836_005929 [Candelina mexicana]
MSRLRCQHIVSIVFTYEEQAASSWGKRSYRILSEPVAEDSMDDFLSATGAITDASMRAKLYKWLGCLASGDDVLCVDFGLSKDFDENVENTTTGYAGQKTPIYCAPEGAAEEPRGRPADMFSLGCGFSGMVIIGLGDSQRSFVTFAVEKKPVPSISTSKVSELALALARKAFFGGIYLCWAASLLQPDAQLRINATGLAKMMRSVY